MHSTPSMISIISSQTRERTRDSSSQFLYFLKIIFDNCTHCTLIWSTTTNVHAACLPAMRPRLVAKKFSKYWKSLKRWENISSISSHSHSRHSLLEKSSTSRRPFPARRKLISQDWNRENGNVATHRFSNGESHARGTACSSGIAHIGLGIIFPVKSHPTPPTPQNYSQTRFVREWYTLAHAETFSVSDLDVFDLVLYLKHAAVNDGYETR